MTANSQFVRRQLEAAYRARKRGNREQAIQLLVYAIAEGDGSADENLQSLVEEAQRHADRRRPHPTTPPTRPPK